MFLRIKFKSNTDYIAYKNLKINLMFSDIYSQIIAHKMKAITHVKTKPIY